MILDRIIRQKRIEVEKAKRNCPLESITSEIKKTQPAKDFFKAVEPHEKIKIIAEIKWASPSKGMLRKDFNPTEIAKGYRDGGASAISVLTDRDFFKGDLTHLRAVRGTVEIPLLRKDFTIDPYQVYEARLYGADAVLLIASVLCAETITELLSVTHSLGMNAIVEVHNEVELEKAILAGGRIIGINNRDLKTFNVNLDVSIRLSKLIPKEKIAISESGLGSIEDIRRLKEEGIYAFLIGETFMRAENPGKQLEKLLTEL